MSQLIERLTYTSRQLLLKQMFNQYAAKLELDDLQRDPEPDWPHSPRTGHRLLGAALHVLPGVDVIKLFLEEI